MADDFLPFQRLPVPCHSMGPDLLLREVNDAWVRYIGYPRSAVLGRSFAEFLDPLSAQRYRERTVPELIRNVPDGETRAAEYRLVKASGEIADIILTARPERDPRTGRFLHSISVITDITARNRAEAAVRQSQKLEALGSLAGGIAHDFNNLLAVVLGSLELLARRLPPQDQRATRLIEAALQGTRRGEALTTRLLAFARQQELCPRPLDLSGFLASFRPMLGELLGPRITFHVDLPPDIWLPHVDPNQFELALLSLAANARDAMPNGGRLKLSAGNVTLGEANDVFIEATPRPAVGTGDYIVLRLSDDGSGMDEVALARAADPFFTTKGPAIASGLGLSMAHGFALQSGGSLRIDSVPGEGTTVELWLPRTPQAVSAPRAEPHATGSSPPAAPLRVLLVDDDPLVAANARAMLEELGHHDIRMAGSGEEAMRLLARDAPVDLLVADYMMPGMTGVQLAARVRERFPSLPILLASGFADLEGSLGTRWPRLRKPYSLNGLAEALAGVMLPARG